VTLRYSSIAATERVFNGDLDPYIMSPKAIEKLRLVHEVIAAARGKHAERRATS